MDPRKKPSGENKNLMWALLVSLAVLMGYDYYMGQNMPAQESKTLQALQAVQQGNVPGAPEAPQEMAQTKVATPEAQKSARVQLESQYLSGSIALTGGRLDDLVLPDHKVSKDEEELITLFAPSGEKVQFLDAGWQSSAVISPNGNTEWKAMSERLTVNSPLVLTWENKTGQRFERIFEVQENSYVIKVTDKVTNTGQTPVQLSHYAQLHKTQQEVKGGMYDPEMSTFFRFLGPQAFLDEVKYEADYDDLQDGQDVKVEGRKGWVGVTDRYFMSAILPNQQSTNTVRIQHSEAGGKDFFSMIVQGAVDVVYPNETREISYRVFAGPQVISEMEKENVTLEEAVDYGWFHFIARPIFDMVMFFDGYVSNLGVSIILGTLVLKILLFPLANKSYRSMAAMRKVQPKMVRLKEQYGDQRERMAMEMMALYKEHKVNPASGCWPMLVQIPIFFAFYKVILISFPFRHADFGGWIHNLSEMDPYFVLPVLMGVSMFVQQKLSPPPADPVQAQVMKFLPVIFTVMFAMFPAGLVLYWLTNNVLSIAQQWYITRQVEQE